MKYKYAISNYTEDKFNKKDEEYEQLVDKLKDLYKTLVQIEKINYSNQIKLDIAHKTLEIAATSVGRSSCNGDLSQEFKEVNQYTFNWINHYRNECIKKDFSDVYEKYINN